MNILFCNIAWMKNYEGITENDKPRNGGSYVTKNGNAYESNNFKNYNGKCYGYVRVDGSINHPNATKNTSYLDDVLIIWCAKSERNKTVIIGWYKHARVYRDEQHLYSESDNLYYRFEADVNNCNLLSEDERVYQIGRASKVGKGKGFGQSNIWYANEEIAQKEVVPKVIKYIENFETRENIQEKKDILDSKCEGDEERLVQIKQVLIDWCKNRMEYNKDINFNINHCVGKTHIKFTTNKIDAMLPPTDDNRGEWGNGHYIFYEINNRRNKVFIYLVVGIKDIPQDYKGFIDLLLQSTMNKVKVSKTYCIEKFSIYEYTDKEDISLVKEQIARRLNHVFETAIIKYEKEIETLWNENKLGKMINVEQYNKELEAEIKRISTLNDIEIKNLISKSDRPELITTYSKVYKRNPAVVIATLRRANGYCEKCGCKAPFNRKTDNTPYLEVHHKVALSDGGSDNIENTIAVCPNCHREFHFGL